MSAPSKAALKPGGLRAVRGEGEVPLGRGVDRVLLSARPEGPLDGAALELSVVRDGRPGAWMAALGRGATASGADRIDVDHLRLGGPAGAVRVRTRGLRRVTLAAAGPLPRFRDSPFHRAGSALCRLAPFLTQRDLPASIAGRTCCPTCVTMVLAHFAGTPALAAVAEAIRDPEHGIYGNWLRSTAVAAGLGRPLRARQARSWAAVAGWLRRGVPLIASIAYEEGRLPGAVMPRTDGHLVVVIGLDGRGGVVVHDPAGVEGERLTLDAAAFGRAWAGHGAVALV